MLTIEQVQSIASRRENGEGLESIIESMGLPVLPTLIDLKKNHRDTMKASKEMQRQVTQLNADTSNGAFIAK